MNTLENPSGDGFPPKLFSSTSLKEGAKVQSSRKPMTVADFMLKITFGGACMSGYVCAPGAGREAACRQLLWPFKM